ncbi:MAG: hypothetical protein WBO82_06845 [Neisseria sp.]
MPTEKIYYAIIILLASISVLTSPFFYISRKNKQRLDKRVIKRQWYIVLFSNILIVSALVIAWYIWWRA